MAKLADAADLKSADPQGLWGFDSPSRHQVFNHLQWNSVRHRLFVRGARDISGDGASSAIGRVTTVAESRIPLRDLHFVLWDGNDSIRMSTSQSDRTDCIRN
jgi:hypothetical protein